MSTIPTAELALLRRRIVYVEAALAQLLGESGRLREWFSATELAALQLPGLPTTRHGIGQLARSQDWRSIIRTGRGEERRFYHFSALPARAFAAMIDLVLRAAPPGTVEREAGGLPALPRPDRPLLAQADPTPAWVLPLVRLMRSDNLPLEAALLRLPERVPASVPCPSPDLARTVLSALGLWRETG